MLNRAIQRGEKYVKRTLAETTQSGSQCARSATTSRLHLSSSRFTRATCAEVFNNLPRSSAEICSKGTIRDRGFRAANPRVMSAEASCFLRTSCRSQITSFNTIERVDSQFNARSNASNDVIQNYNESSKKRLSRACHFTSFMRVAQQTTHLDSQFAAVKSLPLSLSPATRVFHSALIYHVLSPHVIPRLDRG